MSKLVECGKTMMTAKYNQGSKPETLPTSLVGKVSREIHPFKQAKYTLSAP